MPASSVASHTPSHSSAGSRRARTRQYRTVSDKSQVDESLFGEPKHVTDRQAMLEEKWTNNSCGEETKIEVAAARRSAGRTKNGKPSKEKIQIITKDLIRNLVVPKEDPSGNSIILPYYDYLRIKARSHVLTDEEKAAIAEQMKREKEEAMNAAQERKNFMKEMDLTRSKNEKLTDLEEEARAKAEHLLEKAMEQRQEQEDEIKHLNELILNAKIQAIRDAQILEKQQIHSEHAEEERRLDDMMEVDRKNAIEVQEAIEKRRKEQEMIGASKILDQISENEQNRLLELERKDMENVAMLKYIEGLMEEQREKLEAKKEQQVILREELNKANEMILRRKDIRREQEKMLDAQVLEYQRAKAEREAAYEAEQERIRIEKEKEVARLRALQERARDEQSERDALRAKRAAEQNEREWRRKEMEEMQKKSETEAQLRIERAKQMDQKEHFLAVQAARERAEFQRVLRAQKELIEKDRRKEEEAAKRAKAHGADVMKQIRDKEEEKIAERNAFFEEGVRVEDEAHMRRQRLEEVKARKMRELRAAGIPEKYLAQVERKVNLPQAV